MKVKELIELLYKLDQEKDIHVSDHEDGNNNIKEIEESENYYQKYYEIYSIY